MTRKYLMWDESIFRDISVFDPDYVPENYIHRENQMKELAYSISPALRGSRPLNTMCLGPPGTGKTTAIMKLFEELEGETGKVITAYVNCQLHDSRFSVFSVIFRRIFGYPLPTSGVPFSKVYETILRKLSSEDMILIVALDDLNFIFNQKNVNEILYTILRAHEEKPGVKMGVIAIATDVKYSLRLDPRVQSIFMPNEIIFPLYEWQEVFDILMDRVNLGFYPGVVETEAVEKITDYVMETGDLRIGIDLLKRSGLHAEHEARRKVTVEDVESVYGDAKRVFLRKVLRGLSRDEIDLLKMIYSEEGSVKAGSLYTGFREKRKIGYTKFYEMINKLETVRLIDIVFSGKGEKGRTRYIHQRLDRNTIFSAIDEFETRR